MPVVLRTLSLEWGLIGGPRRQEVGYGTGRSLRSVLATVDQEGFPRYLQTPHQGLRTQGTLSGPGQVHPPSPIREQHLVSDIKRAVPLWKWIL